MKKKIFIALILCIIFSVFALLIYINNVFAPVKLKAKIITVLEKNLEARVRIEKVRYNLFNGLIIQNLSVYKEAGDHPYITVKKISFNLLLFPLLQKKIIVPLMRVESPKIYLELDENKKLNLAELTKPATTEKEKQGFSVAVLKISVSDGECYLKDKSVTPNFTRDMTAIKIGAEIKLPQQIKFLLQAKIINPQSNPSFLSAEGEYYPANKNLAAQIKLNSFIVREYLTYLKRLPFLWSEGIVDAELKLSLKEKLLNVTGSISAKAAVVRTEKFAFSGDLTLKPQVEYRLDDKIAKYNAVAQIARGKFIGLKFTKEITEIQGDIYLDETAARSANLKAKIFDSPLKIRGSLENFAQPVLRLKIFSDRVKLNSLVALLPNPPQDLVFDGGARLVMDLAYDAQNPPLQIKGIAEIDSPKLKLAALKSPLENIRGAIVFSSAGLTWPSLFFTYKQIPYKTSGSITDFNSPHLDCELVSKDLSFKSDLTLRDNLVTIKSCTGKYRQSEFDIKGSADTRESTLDLSGKINLYLKNMLDLLTDKAQEKLKKLKLDGACKIEGSVKASAKNLKNLEANLKVTSDAFSIYDLKIDNARFGLRQNNAMLNIDDFAAKSYDGTINAQFSLNLSEASSNYSAKFILENIDLAKLKKDTKFKDKDIAGLFSIKGELGGSAANIDTLKGNGYFTLKDGKIWEINLFKGLGEFLFLPIYQKISFSEIEGDFFIKDKKIEFVNSFLGGKMMELATNGNIGFDGAIDLDMHTRISKSLLEDSPDLRKFSSLIFGNLLNLKISGTLQKPEYKVVPIPKALLKEIKRFFLKH
jgi:hypothetical protein